MPKITKAERKYWKQYYRKHREKILKKNRKWYRNNKKYQMELNKLSKEKVINFIKKIKSVPCMDCGIKYPFYVMDFDHRPRTKKLFSIAFGAFNHSREEILREIAKCDIVCSNCHRIRTHKRRKKKNNY